MKIRERIERLRATVPNKDAATGQLYRDAADRKKVYVRARMHIIMRSTLNAHRVHEIIFKKSAGKTPQQWRVWFDKNLRNILANSVLPGLNVTDESQSWQALQMIGWVGEKPKGKRRDKRKSRNSTLAKKRHQTKRQGARGGKSNLRRRHGNRKRKT